MVISVLSPFRRHNKITIWTLFSSLFPGTLITLSALPSFLLFSSSAAGKTSFPSSSFFFEGGRRPGGETKPIGSCIVSGGMENPSKRYGAEEGGIGFQDPLREIEGSEGIKKAEGNRMLCSRRR